MFFDSTEKEVLSLVSKCSENAERILSEKYGMFYSHQEIDGFKALSNKFSFIGIGQKRIVYKISEKYVIKIALDSSGKNANKKEYKRFIKRIDLHDFLAKTFYCSPSGDFIIAENCKLLDKYENVDFPHCVIAWCENLFFNMGVNNIGNIVAIDYEN